MNLIWRFFPVLYVLPFIGASLWYEPVQVVGDIARWGVMGLGLFLGFFVGKPKKKQGYFWTGIYGGSLLLFLLVCLASYAWSINPGYTLMRAASMALLFGCSFSVFWRWADEFGEKKLVTQIVDLLGVLFFLNLVFATGLGEDAQIAGRFRGLFENPNNIGLIVSLSLPLSMGRAFGDKRWLSWTLFLGFLVSALMCGSRTAVAAAGLSCAILLSLQAMRRGGNTLVVGAVASLVFAFGTQTEFFQERILRSETLDTLSNRSMFWDLAKETYIPESPYYGFGFGTDGDIAEHFGINLSDLYLRGYGVMSSYYGLAVQLGVPAAIFFFTLLGWLPVAGLIKRWRDLRLGTYCAAVIAGMMVCVTESAIYSAGNCFAWLLWIVVMLLMRRILKINRVLERKARRVISKIRQRPVRRLVNA
jgi:hypothetical protein